MGDTRFEYMQSPGDVRELAPDLGSWNDRGTSFLYRRTRTASRINLVAFPMALRVTSCRHNPLSARITPITVTPATAKVVQAAAVSHPHNPVSIRITPLTVKATTAKCEQPAAISRPHNTVSTRITPLTVTPATANFE